MKDFENDSGAQAKLEGIPAYDADAVGRIAARVELARIELVSSHFDQFDDRPLPTNAPNLNSTLPTLGLDAEWAVSEDNRQLGCIVICASFTEQAEGSTWFRLVTRFRALYDVDGTSPMAEEDVQLFVWWNTLLTVWPYWREFMSSMLRRSGFPTFTAPLLPEPQMGKPGAV